MSDRTAEAATYVTEAVGDAAGRWDVAGSIPRDVLDRLGAKGLLCAQVPEEFGGPGFTSGENGELTAHTGGLCSSLRSIMTSQGMAAWAVQRLGDAGQRRAHLPGLASGTLAAVAFSERGAGSDLSEMAATFVLDGDTLVLTGEKVWVTGAAYADVIVVFARYGDGAAAAVVPADAPGVTITPVADPLGCRAAGHAGVRFDAVRLPGSHLLGGSGLPMDWLVTSVLTYGRLSVAWGCTGILRGCRAAAGEHARTREQFGRPIGDHQLVAGHLADLVVAEATAARCCEHASRCWDDRDPDLVTEAVLAKYVAAGNAARGAALAVQVLGSAGATDGHPVARAYRDAKLMEIIEGSNELSRLLLSGHAKAVRG